ncbi:MAG: putative rane protein [Rubrobacteraceae bacterium]|nr:putative rane protein [Rubrobacteraceae bacterium]
MQSLHDGEMMEGWHTLGWLWVLIPLALWVVLFVLVAWGVTMMFFIQRGRGRERSELQWSQAEEILRERFARGELDAEEYIERSRVLSGDHSNYGSSG